MRGASGRIAWQESRVTHPAKRHGLSQALVRAVSSLCEPHAPWTRSTPMSRPCPATSRPLADPRGTRRVHPHPNLPPNPPTRFPAAALLPRGPGFDSRRLHSQASEITREEIRNPAPPQSLHGRDRGGGRRQASSSSSSSTSSSASASAARCSAFMLSPFLRRIRSSRRIAAAWFASGTRCM